jgi:hypothetical protein
LLTLLLALAAFADCPSEPWSEVQGAREQVHEAYVQLKPEVMDEIARGLPSLLSCVDRVLTAEDALLVHDLQALLAFSQQQLDLTRRAVAGARAIDPDWMPLPGVLSEVHPLAQIALEVPPTAGRQQDLAPSDWTVDGEASSAAPLDRAFVLQRVSGGKAVYTGYFSSVLDIPAAINKATGVRGVALMVSISGVGRLSSAVQEPQGDGGPWGAEQASAPGGGAAVGVRWWPRPFVGAELDFEAIGGVDAVEGGGFASSTEALALAGYPLEVGDGWLRIGARAGLAVDQMRAWGNAPAEPSVFTIPSLLVGPEITWLGDPVIIRGGADLLLASGWVPYQLRARGELGVLVADSLALEAGVSWATKSLSVQTSLDEPIGRRTDRDLTVRIGVGVWR